MHAVCAVFADVGQLHILAHLSAEVGKEHTGYRFCPLTVVDKSFTDQWSPYR